MQTITVVGPLKTEQDARETCEYLGDVNHSIYRTGDDDAAQWYVERHVDVMPSTIFGYSFEEIQAKQRG